MFGTNKNIKTANETIAALTKDKETLTAQLSEANVKIESLSKSIADIETLKKEYTDKIETLTKEHESALTETKNSVMKQVGQKVEALGITESEIFKPSASAMETYETAIAKLTAMPRGSKERMDYFKKNRGLLTQSPEALTTETVTE